MGVNQSSGVSKAHAGDKKSEGKSHGKVGQSDSEPDTEAGPHTDDVSFLESPEILWQEPQVEQILEYMGNSSSRVSKPFCGC